MRKTLIASIALAALALSSPAFAWRAITIHNKTDPVNIHAVTFTAPYVPAVHFTLDLGAGWRVFGPLPETGPCLRTVSVVVTNPYLGWATKAAATPMNVCTEGNIYVSGAWPGGSHMIGSSELVITHGP